eukprot:1926239-Rhodomonas_salina.1
MAGLQYFHSHKLHVVTGRFFQQVAPAMLPAYDICLCYCPVLSNVFHMCTITYMPTLSAYAFGLHVVTGRLYQQVAPGTTRLLPSYAKCLWCLPFLSAYNAICLCDMSVPSACVSFLRPISVLSADALCLRDLPMQSKERCLPVLFAKD